MPGHDKAGSDLAAVGMTIDQSMIDAYAEITDDFNPIHTDQAFAATTAMGGVIAHGTMSLNLIWEMAEANFGSDGRHIGLTVRFRAPVRPGDTIVASGCSKPEQAGQYAVWIRNQREEIVIEGLLQLGGAA